jgi:hypothetical protein
MTFVVAQLGKCNLIRKWMFQFQNVVVKMQSMFVALVYALGGNENYATHTSDYTLMIDTNFNHVINLGGVC